MRDVWLTNGLLLQKPVGEALSSAPDSQTSGSHSDSQTAQHTSKQVSLIIAMLTNKYSACFCY